MIRYIHGLTDSIVSIGTAETERPKRNGRKSGRNGTAETERPKRNETERNCQNSIETEQRVDQNETAKLA